MAQPPAYRSGLDPGEAMGGSQADGKILESLDALHAAFGRGDVDGVLDGFTDLPQGATNGKPRRVATLREFFTKHREVLKKRRADLSAVETLHDPEPERFWRWVDGEKVASRANAIVLPVRYDNSGGLGMAPPNQETWPPYPDTLFMMLTMVLEDDGRWRIVHDRVLPDPSAETHDRVLLERAGVVLDKQTMAWTRKIDAPPGRVWRAVSTSAGLRRWWLSGGGNFKIELGDGGVFNHHWQSTIHGFEKNRYIDFNEFRIELRPDGDGTLVDFLVYTMDGNEWRAFWQAEEAPIFYDQFGGVDPWSAAGWHHGLDRLEASLTDREARWAHDDPTTPWQPGMALKGFYLDYLRAQRHLRELSSKEALSPAGADPGTFGSPRTVEGYGPPKPRARGGPSVSDAAIAVEQLPEQPALVVEGKTVPGNYLASLAQAVAKVRAHMQKQGIEAAGRPFMRYLKVDESRGERVIHYAAGIPVSGKPKGARAVKPSSLPACRAVTLDFTGSLELIQDGWERIRAHVRKQKAELLAEGPGAHGGWHALLNDPREVGLENTRSKLHLPIRS